MLYAICHQDRVVAICHQIGTAMSGQDREYADQFSIKNVYEPWQTTEKPGHLPNCRIVALGMHDSVMLRGDF